MKFYKETLINLIYSYPRKCILISLFICLTLSGQLYKLESDFSAKYWFNQNDNTVKILEKTQNEFTQYEDIYLMVGEKKTNILTLSNLDQINDLTNKLKSLPEIAKINTLTNYPLMLSFDEEITFKNIYHDQSTQYIFKEIKTNPFYKNRFVAKNQNSTLLILSLKKKYDFQQTNLLIKKIKDIIPNNFSSYFSGFHLVEHNFRKVSQSDLIKILPIISIVFFLIFIFIYGNFFLAIIPLFLFTISATSVFGLSAMLGLKFHNISTVIPAILITVTLADIIHILNLYVHNINSNQLHPEALKNSAIDNFNPTLITTLTTAIGLFSFCATNLTPIIQIGLIAGFGVLFIWFLTYFFFIPLFCLIPLKLKSRPIKFNASFLFKSYLNSPKIWGSSFFVIIIMTSIMSFKVNINTDPFLYFSNSTAIAKSNNFLENNFSQLPGPDLIIDIKSQLRTSEFMQRLYSFEKELIDKEIVVSINSVTELFQKANLALTGSQKLPKEDAKISDIINFLTLFGDQDIHIYQFINSDETYLKTNITWKYKNSKDFIKGAKRIEDLAKKYNLNLKITGQGYLYHQMVDQVVPTLVKSTFIAVFCIVAVIFLLYRNLYWAIISIIPNIVPIFISFSLAYLLNYPIDLTMALVAAVVFGMAIDDTIHILHHLKSHQNSSKEAIFKIIDKTGSALITTTICLVIGFSSFIIGDFKANAYFGIICSVSFISALLLDLVLLPKLIISNR